MSRLFTIHLQRAALLIAVLVGLGVAQAQTSFELQELNTTIVHLP